ncbi:MAG: hypothetical protein JST98_01835 [Bacteroidetes bacterium]|nr:hypothetical protein [Bacteroidota bacterium]
MDLLIADIGGSSSRWGIIRKGEAVAWPEKLAGFNPASGSPDVLQQQLKAARLDPGHGEALDVFAYGAGCGAPDRAGRMHGALRQVWPQAVVHVGTDLLGAARSLYGTKAGLVLILGTGMNAGHYDGNRLHCPMPSLGYILGDEGSGADIGKHLLRDVLHGLAPEVLRDAIFPQGPDLPALLDAVYRSPASQAFVAAFTARLADHLGTEYVHDLLASRFFALGRLLQLHFSAEERAEVRASGSVAHGFRPVLEQALLHGGMHLSAAVKDPLPGLLAFHAQALR